MPKSLNLDLNLSDNFKYTLGFLLALVFAFFCLFFVIMPLCRDNEAQKQQLTKDNAKLAEIKTFATQYQDYDALVKIQEMKIDQAKKKLPDTVSVPELVLEYSKLAQASGVSLLGVTPRTVLKQGSAFSLPIEVDLEGDYFKLITFLQQVENAERFTLVQGASYDSERTGENLRMKARFIVYALKKIEGAPTTTSKDAPKTAK